MKSKYKRTFSIKLAKKFIRFFHKALSIFWFYISSDLLDLQYNGRGKKWQKFSGYLGPTGGAKADTNWTSYFPGTRVWIPGPHPSIHECELYFLFDLELQELWCSEYRIGYQCSWLLSKSLHCDNILVYFNHWKLVHASINPKYVFSVHEGLGFYLGGANSCQAVWFQRLWLLRLPCPIPKSAFHTCSPT